MSFNKLPSVSIKEQSGQCFSGWEQVGQVLNGTPSAGLKRRVIVVETYHGVDHTELLAELKNIFSLDYLILSTESMKSVQEVLQMTSPDVTDDRIFGVMSNLEMVDFFDQSKLIEAREHLKKIEQGVVLVYGYGASLIAENTDTLIYADMARWEIQQRMRRNEVDNLGILNKGEEIEGTYKRAYFVDWRVCDRLKRELMHKWDFVLDTNKNGDPKMISGTTFGNAMEQTVKQPFSVVPFFDSGPWGGQWMKEVCDLDRSEENFAWCFNCVPEENSVLLEFDTVTMELPSINVVFYKPQELLGDKVFAKFGAEFPIRFDFLDTMGGGSLSIQVHPLTDYIKEHFGMNYTQDESYYIMDASEDAVVYLGVKDEIDSNAMIEDLRSAKEKGEEFDADKYVKKWKAKKHDHFLIPAGTVHCSGTNCMVLEISATPYIFTFKLWDWGRVGMDGKPRPINIEHGKNVIKWDRTPNWTKKNLINAFETLPSENGYVEEKTGLHESEFIETRRHWFSDKVTHYTGTGVNVLCLVEGEQALVECPENTFDSFIVNYAETFIVPAQVKSYSIKPTGVSKGKKVATVKAYVR